jgi:hypothetical protein
LLPKKATVFAIELAGTFVFDLKCGAGSVETIQEHETSCCLQPKLLLILKKAHSGQRSKMVMERLIDPALHVARVIRLL